ncbi:hypothetical protein FNH05_26055 [Amycolatopsis rhizosphaerae]|uniref:Uncharacterized protein n=1 Tax=Amycolatopsis rhizosphaerae TaxID=2053003 RepID=A0A558BGI3_9PSEU|nr:hypothetical protein [Amycolatopsis rhizosphaerae]TVT35610.1 hypothetical protein FNH05_26055 [Amycolatopsis rhizosphaerae]
MRLERWLGGLGGAVWIGSWYLMYLEITRWHHVKPSLAFNSDVAPGARPGQALILLYVACVVGPLVVLAILVRGIVHHRRFTR